jgi:cell wall-associated NlpC family hydrolase
MNDLIGLPYKAKGRDSSGYDCWGLVMEVFYRISGVRLPDYNLDYDKPEIAHNRMEIESVNPKWIKLQSPELNCLVLMKQHPVFTQHVGVYIGEGKFIHASLSKGVTVDRLIDPIYKNGIKGFYKYAE